MKKLKEVVDKQRDEIRAKDRELTLKNEDIEAVSDRFSSFKPFVNNMDFILFPILLTLTINHSCLTCLSSSCSSSRTV